MNDRAKIFLFALEPLVLRSWTIFSENPRRSECRRATSLERLMNLHHLSRKAIRFEKLIS